MAEANVENLQAIEQFDDDINSEIASSGDNEGISDFVTRLHEFLDFYQLFDTFIGELRDVVPFDSVEYEDISTETALKNGYTGKQRCEYTLTYEGSSLGQIRITRETKFLNGELDLIEVMLAGLSLPLRNALRYQQAIRMAQRDELTGLRNGSYYHDIVEIEIERSERYKNPFSLLMFDLDDFEEINKQYGRQAGDFILQEVATRIETKARGSDVVYRNGGDEFLIFLPNTEKEEAKIVAQRIKDYVFSEPFMYDGKIILFTLSAGVVTVTHGDTADKLINRVDRAIFHAKVLGKDRIYAENNCSGSLSGNSYNQSPDNKSQNQQE